MTDAYPTDLRISEKRLQLDKASNKLVDAPKRRLFLKGPIPIEWLSKTARLPGKTLNVALALWWLHGMANGKPFKLTRAALASFSVERDAASAGLVRLEQAGLIKVERRMGQRPVISIIIQKHSNFPVNRLNQSRHLELTLFRGHLIFCF